MPSKIVFWKQMRGLLSTIASAAGLMPTVNLGTGTANTTTFLRGDQTYATAIQGSTGSTDNRILRSDGTGGLTVQSSVPSLDDTGNLTGLIGLVAGSGSFAVTSTFDAVMWNGGKLGFASTGAVTTASTADAYFVRNGASSIGAKGVAGIDAAFTCAAITSSSQVTQVPPASVTLGTNGQFSIEMTSNTAGNLVYRGSDGTTRRMALVFV